MIQMQLNVEDRRKVDRFLNGMAELFGGKGFREFTVTRVHPYLAAAHKGYFERETAPNGQPWEPLSAATEQFRRVHGFPAAHPINVRTGKMRSFVTDRYDLEAWLGGMSVGEVTKVRLTMPSLERDSTIAAKISRAQQGGISQFGNAFPARPVIGYAPADPTVITGMAATWFSSMIEALL